MAVWRYQLCRSWRVGAASRGKGVCQDSSLWNATFASYVPYCFHSPMLLIYYCPFVDLGFFISLFLPCSLGYAQPFEPPTKSQILRFRYTTYMGDKHPAEPKVVMEFTVADLNLSPVPSRKLIKLVGPRYNPAKGLVKLSCEMFETQAQNKRYLSDLLDKLLAEANVYLHSLLFPFLFPDVVWI